jgi:hypothetical protein
LFYLDCNDEIEPLNCSASSEFTTSYGIANPCHYAINKDTRDEWVTHGEGAGAWIKINMEKVYKVKRMQIKHRKDGNEFQKFKVILLEFSDGTKIEHELGNHLDFNEITFDKETDFVKISAVSSYGPEDVDRNNGFNVINIFGCLPGIKFGIMH